METPIDPQDWILINEFDSSHNPKPFADAPIKPDHFSLDPINNPSDEEIDEGGVDSDNPSSPDEAKCNLDASTESSTGFWLDSASEGGEEEVAQVSRGELGKDGILEGNGKRVWWRKATEVVRVWVLRVRPVWSISLTAGVILGVAVVGRRLYRTRQKERRMALKIAIDDKVSENASCFDSDER